MGISRLEAACNVYFGQTYDPDFCNLRHAENPEEIYAAKESFESLSDEAKLVLKTIIELPDACFWSTGELIIYELQSFMRRAYKWNTKKVDKHRKELACMLGVKV